LEQTVINLVINARDAMPEGGKLVIGTAVASIGAGEVMLHSGVPEGEYALLTVADTGCGITPENLERIFEPFFTTKPKERGTGLGLSMVYGIVRQSGGHLRVRSTVGAGTTFSIYLPLVGEAERDAHPAAVPRTGDLIGPVEGAVLVVDDEELIRTSVKAFLENVGFTVTACESGEEALRMAEELDDKLVMLVTDVVMPGMSGIDIASALVDRKPALPIIFMSGYAAGESGDKRFKHAKFLQKPFSRAGLIAAVHESFDS
jgi:CheY-like chemotaxis protein